MHLWFALARVPPPRLQPDETSRVATLPESMRVLDGQNIGRGDQVSHTLHLFEQRRFWVLSPAIFSMRRSYSLMRSLSDSTSRNNGSKASRNPALNPLPISRLT